MRIFTRILPLLTLVLMHPLPELSAGELTVDTTQNNSVTFFARSTMNDFTGTTGQLSASLSWPGPEAPFGDSSFSGKIFMSVDLASLDTGIGKRNSHMRDKYLETDKYPRAVFSGILSDCIPENDSTILATSTGMLSIHGVAQKVVTPVRITTQGAGYAVLVSFPINIYDFNIKQPGFLFIKMNPEIELQVDSFMSGP